MAVVGRGVFCREEDQRHLSARRSGAVGCLLDMIALAMASTISNGSCSSQMPCRSPAAKQCCKWQVFKGLNRWHQQRYVRAIPVSKQYYRGVATKYCMHSIIYYYLRLYCKYVTPYLGRSPRRCHQHHAPLQRSRPGPLRLLQAVLQAGLQPTRSAPRTLLKPYLRPLLLLSKNATE